MKITSFTFNAFRENTYLLYDPTGACAILDPGMADASEDDVLFKYIAHNGLRPEIILNTHCHIDHILGNASASARFHIPIRFHALEQKTLDDAATASLMWNIPYRPSPPATSFLNEHDTIMIGNSTLEIRFVPGHAPGHIAFIHHASRSILSGDVLFRGSVGRTDLPGCNTDDLVHSIRHQLYTLPDDYTVYPGHGESTSIGWEKKNNPFVNGE